MFNFEKMFTPKIISFLYVITLIFFGLSATGFFLGKNFLGFAVSIMLGLLSRLFFELIILRFKSNEYLRDIRDMLRQLTLPPDSKFSKDADFNNHEFEEMVREEAKRHKS